jgi:hypothetical protein
MSRLRPHNMRSPGDPDDHVPATQGVISGLVEYTDITNGVATVEIGVIPAGGRFLEASVKVITAFNSGGGDDELTVGIASDYDYLLTAGNPDVADSETSGELLDWAPTTDQTIYARFTHSGTAPAAGKALVVVRFEQPLS